MRRAPILALLVLALPACTGAPGPQEDSGSAIVPPPVLPTSSATASPQPSATEPITSPLTGMPGGQGKPVMIVKLDNTRAAQPHVGLTSADMVYVEQVEWGLTRLAAIYSSKLPKAVGPVRSARITDVYAFAPFGKAAFVFSGAQQKLWPKLRAADWRIAADDIDGSGFFRDRDGRYAPTNLMASPKQILAATGKVARVKDMGLAFGAEVPAGGKKVATVTTKWPYSTVAFKWNSRTNKFDVWIDGRPARDTTKPYRQAASTVVIQYVKEGDSGYGDKFGGRTPLAQTVGHGSALMLRDGRAFKIKWSRPTRKASTRYTMADGQPAAFRPGQVWVVLKDKEAPAKVTSPR